MFRDKDGIWSKVDFREVATPQGFARNPAKVHHFYNMRRRGLVDDCFPTRRISPWRGLEREFAGAFLLVTQNIEDTA